MDKQCLFIDDDPDEVKSVLKNLTEIGSKKGITIKCDLLGLTDEFYNSSMELDPEKIKAKLHGELMDKYKYDLVACDFNIEDENLNGLDIVRIVREKNRNCAVILYSGDLDRIATHIAHLPTQKDRYKKIKTIVDCKITDFMDRSAGYEAHLIHILKKQIRLEVIIEKKLREHGDLKFNHGYEKFLGKSLKEIAHEIEIESDHGNMFTQEIIERGIAHMIELNSLE
ncbi:MAG: hypothetical protein KJ882_09515 [Proteobacteria bacterium]|nr:hypothetical protein [Pseudomonadota bacterium]MBU4010993.1 hypothetical protein [Pseudomonadota bacterium]